VQYNLTDKLSDQQKNDVTVLLKEKASSLLQYPEWVDATQPGKKKLFVTAYNQENVLTCYALIIVRWWHGIIWFGPVCSDLEYLPEFITNTAKLAKGKGIGLLSIVGFWNDEIRNAISEKVQKEYCISRKNCVNAWATIKIGLLQTEEELFSHFSNNHKRAIKKAVKLGFTVRQIQQVEDIISFSKLYNEMYRKRKSSCR